MMSIFFYLLGLLLSLCLLHITLQRRNGARGEGVEIKGSILLVKKHLFDLTDMHASVLDRVYEFFGRGVSFQLVSATVVDPNDRENGIVGEPAYLQGWITKLTSFNAGNARYNVSFNWKESQGIPGAVIVKNYHRYQLYLKTLTVEGVPGKGHIHFVCNSWIYPAHNYSCDRIFFANDAYLPSDTPKPLRAYRENELNILRGSGIETRFQDHDRVYNYDLYNDLGDPSKGEKYTRPVLGGSEETPYPRRGRTGSPGEKDNYLPRDEYFRQLKLSDFYAYVLKSLIKKWILGRGESEFLSFDSVNKLYGKIWYSGLVSWLARRIPFEFIRELLRTDGEPWIRFPFPHVIKTDEAAWKTDREFGRQMLAGLNPVLLRAAEDSEIYEFNDAKQRTMKATNTNEEHREYDRRYFVLDHSYIKDFQDEIRKHTNNRVYASKTLLYRMDDDTLNPYGILLISKSNDGQYEKDYYFPDGEDEKAKALWMLAKAFVIVNDSGYHQLVSHWLYTHAVIEPFVIASNRHLSVMHPVHKLLSPHFRDTMNINHMARNKLINANGVIEKTFFPGSFAIEMTSKIYKDWNLLDHALPTDLLNRRVAAMDGEDIRLLIKDYPYAEDGLLVWTAIEGWVRSYCSIYYPSNDALQADEELQQWWSEIREVGHGDLKDKKWWPKMQTLEELTECCTIVIWLASAFHAAVNFGQYAYGGYVPNRPSLNRLQMPKTEDEIEEMMRDPERYYLKTITAKPQVLDIMETLQVLSRHSGEEVYLGQRDRDDDEWTSDAAALAAFNDFAKKLMEDVERTIETRNSDGSKKNRRGDVEVPYTLLYPNTSGKCVAGLGGKGIPNSVSI